MFNEPEIVMLEAKTLVGQSIEMSLAKNKTVELFSGFMPKRKHIPNAVSNEVYEIFIYNDLYFKNFNPTTTFLKWATVQVSNDEAVPEQMDTLNLEAGLYAVFNFKGSPQGLGNLMKYILSDWLPKSEYQLDVRPHFNVLGEKYKNGSPDSEEEVWIPIQLK